MGVVAVAPGEVLRIDQDHQESTPEALERVRNGATLEDMDLLRGLEVWVRHGRVSVYAHLKPPYPKLKVGDQVERGDPLPAWAGAHPACSSRGRGFPTRVPFSSRDSPLRRFWPRPGPSLA